jgi:hypothetical protein
VARSNLSPREVVHLAKAHLGRPPSVYFAPSIPRAKEANARAVHSAHLPPGEPILVLYDGTLFGSAENGFLVTPERLCWKNMLEHPRQIPWGELDPSTVRCEVERIGVAGGGIHASIDLAFRAPNLIVAIAENHFGAAGGPYRKPPDGSADSLSRLVVLARKHVGELEHVYYHPSIPPHKLRNARAIHAAHLAPGEPVAVLYDDTLFESARDGFLITPDRLYWKSLAGVAACARWPALAAESIVVRGNLLHLRGGTINITAGPEIAARVASLFAVIVRESTGNEAG